MVECRMIDNEIYAKASDIKKAFEETYEKVKLIMTKKYKRRNETAVLMIETIFDSIIEGFDYKKRLE